MRGFDVLVNTSFCFDPTSFRFIQTSLRGPRIIGEHRIPSTPLRICFFTLPQFVADAAARARIVHGNKRFGKGFDQLDVKSRLRNGAIRLLEPNLCVFYP